MSINFYVLIFAIICTSCGSADVKKETIESEGSEASAADPLPSWNDVQLKKDIIDYISRVTKEGNADFIPVESRIATFDNDGTLWAERPYVQELFAYYQVRKMVEKNPALAQKQPFKAVIDHDKSYFEKGGDKALIQLIAATHTGMPEEEFEAVSKDFAANTKYPGRNVSLKGITYQPQLELLNYLRANGFKIFICTGGTIEFVRSISNELYGIPKDQVIGTTFKYKFTDSNNSISRTPEIEIFNDKMSKPVAIQEHIGQRPVFACGNEGGGGDIYMLKYSQGNKYPSFQMIINHDDSTREFYYHEKDSASLKAAAKYKWHVVSMKNDWREIFAKE